MVLKIETSHNKNMIAKWDNLNLVRFSTCNNVHLRNKHKLLIIKLSFKIFEWLVPVKRPTQPQSPHIIIQPIILTWINRIIMIEVEVKMAKIIEQDG